MTEGEKPLTKITDINALPLDDQIGFADLLWKMANAEHPEFHPAKSGEPTVGDSNTKTLKSPDEVKHCQKASNRYENLLEDAGGDPRVAAGKQALKDLKRNGGWAPTLDARDARVTVYES